MQDSSKEGKPLAVIVGSGFGGAVAACRLAQAGFSVLLLERGRRYESTDFPAMPVGKALMPDIKRWAWQQDQGLWDVQDLGELTSVQAAGFGGGSLIYANVHLRPPASAFGEEWPDAYQGGQALQSYYDLGASMLDVAPITEHRDSQKLVKTEQLKKAASALGQDFFYPPLAVNHQAHAKGKNYEREQAACKNCGSCCTGCPFTAKNTLDYNYLAVAERRGVQVRTQCEVLDIEQLADGNWQLDCLDHLSAKRLQITAKWLFLCAGVVHSTRLMARARLRPKDRQASAAEESRNGLQAQVPVQTRVGLGYYANADAVGVVYDTKEDQFPSKGPTITGAAVNWGSPNSVESSPFVMVQDGGYAAELERLVGILRGGAWFGRNVRSLAHAPAPSSDELRPGTHEKTGEPLPSLLDGLLDAAASGALKPATPKTVDRHFPRFLQQSKRPLLLRQVVQDTVSRTIGERLSQWGLTSKSNQTSGVLARVRKTLASGASTVLESGVQTIFGGDNLIASQAIASLVAGGGTDRKVRASEMLGYSSDGADRRAMLLAMGRDAKPAALLYDPATEQLTADLDLYHATSVYSDEELFMTDIARQLGGELRLNPMWTLLGKPITVHSQGGCRMSDDPLLGVTNPDGMVHDHPNLYVMDGSVLCNSVGVNPSATIVAIAERNIRKFIRAHMTPQWPDDCETEGAWEYREQRKRAQEWAANAKNKHWDITPPLKPARPFKSSPISLQFHENMRGHYVTRADSENPSDPRWDVPGSAQIDAEDREREARAEQLKWQDADFRCAELRGRPLGYAMEFELKVEATNLTRFYEDMTHRLEVSGNVRVRLPGAGQAEVFAIQSAYLSLFMDRHKPYGLTDDQIVAQNAITKGRHRYRTRVGHPPRNQQRFMRYFVSFENKGESYLIEGYKRIRNDPGFDAWRDTSSLFCKLFLVKGAALTLLGMGTAHVDMFEFLDKQLSSMDVLPNDLDSGAALGAFAKFSAFFFGNLQRIYLPQLQTAAEALFHPAPNNVRRDHKRRQS